jgi:hypothetical protein
LAVAPCGSPPFPSASVEAVGLCGISTPFGMLSPTNGQIAYALLTRAPLYSSRRTFSFDLHVLGPPLTFALSQDQTLQLKSGELSSASTICIVLLRLCVLYLCAPSRGRGTRAYNFVISHESSSDSVFKDPGSHRRAA